MTTVTLVRHGETDWNRERRIQGSTDIPLNDTGRDQARAVGSLLRDRFADAQRVVVAASDLSRAHETAAIIADALGVGPPTTYADLRERGYGEAEGTQVDDFHARWGEWSVAQVPGAEPWPDLRSRALRGLQAAARDARRATWPTAPELVVVAHGALIREVIRHATGGAFPASGVRLENGSTHTFLLERDRLSILESATLSQA